MSLEVVSLTTTSWGESGTPTIDVPAVQADDLILLCHCNDGGDNVSLGVNAAGFTMLSANVGADPELGVMYKWSDGTEQSDNIGFTIANSNERSAQHLYIVRGADPDTNPFYAEVAGTPPNLDTGVSAEYLWIAVQGTNGGTTALTTGAPTNYTDLTATASNPGSGSGQTGINSARRLLEAQAEDPGAFTGGSSHSVAATIAIAPAAAGGAGGVAPFPIGAGRVW